jgi:flagellar hook-associated protein 1 FlgK
MGLLSALTIANGGLGNVTSQLAVVSQNVSNANTAGYTLELGQQTAQVADGLECGVRTGVTVRSVNAELQAEAWQQNAAVAALTLRSQALAAINAAHGTPGQGDDLASLTGALNDAFTTLSADPSSAAGQSAVVTAAGNLAGGINRVAAAVGTQRQTAQDSLSQELTQLNTALASIGTLSNQISTLSNQGTGTAALEDQRDAAMSTVAQLTGASFLNQPNGDVQVILPSGITLATDGSAKLTTADSQLGPETAAPPVTLNGQDITVRLTGGQIGANLALRDTELPTFQAELDEFSHNLTQRFAAAGLALFTDPSPPQLPANGPVQASYVGLAARIEVNQAVAGDPALVQKGTAVPPPGASATGASDQTVINNVLNFTFGTLQGDLAPLQNTLASDLQSTASALPATVSTDIQAVTAARAGVAAAGATLAADMAAAAPFPGVLNDATAVASARAAVTAAQGQVYLDQVNGVNPATNGDQAALAAATGAAAAAVTTMQTNATAADATTPGTLAAAQKIIGDWAAIDAATTASVTPAMTQLATDVTAAGSSAVTAAAGTIVGDWNAIDAAQAASFAAPAPQTQGLGLSGTLSAAFPAPPTLAAFAAGVVAVQTGASSDASAGLSTAQAAQTTLNNSVAAVSGVSVDTEMSTMIGLQNAYAANARIITAIQDMWTSLLDIGTSS